MQPKDFASKKTMKREKLFKYLSIGLFALITAILMVATIMEKFHGTEYALQNIYCADWMIALWTAATLSGIIYILQRKMQRQPATLCLHMAFVVILLGALVTHTTGKQGQIHMRIGDYTNKYTLDDGSVEKLPFSLSLHSFNVTRYAGSEAPMDFVSGIVVYDDERIEGTVSMNNIFKHKGYRFYQSGYDDDEKGTFLSISYDPWGIGITYAGYSLLLLSMLLFFLQPGSRFRALLRKRAVVLLLIFTASATNAQERPQTLPKDVAEEFCNLYVNYNDRICPLQTLAIDFTSKVYGKRSYKGYTAEQVLCGWFFFYDEWKTEPMIKIKGAEVKETLGIDGDYAALTDFVDRNGYKLETALREKDNLEIKDFAAANEKFNIISMLCTGTLLKIFPHADPTSGHVTWYSFAETLPSGIPYEEQLFINKGMNLVAEKVAERDYEGTKAITAKIRKYQVKKGGESIPSEARFKAEKLYNSLEGNRLLAMVCLAIGTITFLFFCLKSRENTCVISNACEKSQGYLTITVICVALKILAWPILAYLTLQIALRWYISGHIPLSNGHETMIFMAWCSILLALFAGRKSRLMLPFGYIVCGFTLLVATMGEATPQITPLMPVLQSPLLCIHVLVIMIAYTLLAFTMLNGIAAVIMKITRKNREEEIAALQRTSILMLYPALFLLTAGIFIGAVWANISWGRYWGWDPKEVWALITMLVYSATLHSGSIKAMRRPMFFHIYCIVAFLTVLITYFGVNFILGGMHSYA